MLHEYSYDPLGRLSQVWKDGVLQDTYTYDHKGNRTNNGAQYDDQDRLTEDANYEYAHTENGELETRTDKATLLETTYTFDGFGSLTGVQLEDGTSIEYLIDGQGRRVGKKVDGVMDWRLVYRSLLQPVAEVDAAGTVITRFVYATGRNIPDYAVRGSDTYALLTDHLGSLRLVVNTSTGAVVQRMDYDPWGKVINDEHTGFDPLPFGFAGGIYDRDTELVHFGAREYDPAVGRWISKDPIRFAGGDTNIFAYVGGDPVNLVDPSGQIGLRWGGGVNVMYYFVGAQLGAGVFVDFDPWLMELSGGVYGQTGFMLGLGMFMGGGVEQGAFRDVAGLAGPSFGLAAGCEGHPEFSTGAAVPLKKTSPYVGMPRWGSDFVAASVGPGFGAYMAEFFNWTHIAGGKWNLRSGRTSTFRSSGLP